MDLWQKKRNKLELELRLTNNKLAFNENRYSLDASKKKIILGLIEKLEDSCSFVDNLEDKIKETIKGDSSGPISHFYFHLRDAIYNAEEHSINNTIDHYLDRDDYMFFFNTELYNYRDIENEIKDFTKSTPCAFYHELVMAFKKCPYVDCMSRIEVSRFYREECMEDDFY